MEIRVSITKMIMAILLFKLMLGCVKQDKQLISDYPHMDIVMRQFVESYYRNYFTYPTDIINLYRFIDNNSDSFFLQEKYFFGENIKKFNLYKGENVLIMTYRDTIISVIDKSISPCDYTYMTIPDFFREIACFDKQGLRIKSDKVIEDIKEYIKKVRSKYKKGKFIEGEFEDEFGNKAKYLFVQYNLEQKLTLFCPKDTINLHEYPYFRDIEECFTAISKKYGLSKIIYATRIGYNE